MPAHADSPADARRRGGRAGLLPFLAVAAGLSMAASQWLIWSYAPVETTMGPVQKIFYFHVPLAWWTLTSFGVVFAASLLFLWRRTAFWDQVAGAAAEIGVLFAALVLITGSVWARTAWGVWWTWEPRLTATLVMWFVYAGYLLLRGLETGRERRGVVCAVAGVAAFIDVPLVFWAARLWRGMHPTMSSSGGLEPEMRLALFACLGSWGLVWLFLGGLRLSQHILAARIEAAGLDAENRR